MASGGCATHPRRIALHTASAKASRTVAWDEVQPGDLLFYPEDEHVGIAAGRDWLGLLLVVHCASGTNGVTISHQTSFETAARPVWYADK